MSAKLDDVARAAREQARDTLRFYLSSAPGAGEIKAAATAAQIGSKDAKAALLAARRAALAELEE